MKPELPPSTPRSLAKLVLRLAKLLICALVAYYLYKAVRRDLSKADADLWSLLHINWLAVIGAGLCLAGMNTVQMIRYRTLLFAYGARPTWRQMAAISSMLNAVSPRMRR